MNNNLRKNIDRAIALLETPTVYEKYISIKLSPPSGCCSHCWPETWHKINQIIAPYGPVGHESDALTEKNGNKFVLESHETGLEIIAYLPTVTSIISLTAAIVGLIVVIVKARSNESRNRPSHMRLFKRQIVKGEIEEENIIEIDFPISKGMQKKLEEKIKKAMDKTSSVCTGALINRRAR